jgi:hypothetical protein
MERNRRQLSAKEFNEVVRLSQTMYGNWGVLVDTRELDSRLYIRVKL